MRKDYQAFSLQLIQLMYTIQLSDFFGGRDINVDNLLPDQVPNYWEQAILVAKNPFVAAKFFNLYMKAFISASALLQGLGMI